MEEPEGGLTITVQLQSEVDFSFAMPYMPHVLASSDHKVYKVYMPHGLASSDHKGPLKHLKVNADATEVADE